MKHGTDVLEKASSVLAHSQFDRQELNRRVLDLEHAILCCADDDCAELIAELRKFFPKLNDSYELFETNLEVQFAQQILNGSVEIEEYPLFERFKRLVANEVEMSSMKRNDKVAMIGSGPFPITAILLYKHFGINVVAVDKNPSAVMMSQQVIQRLNLHEGIIIQNGDGQSFADAEISCAVIALLAHPKGLILKNIFENLTKCQFVICRTSHGIRQALYRPTDPSVLTAYLKIAEKRAAGNQTISSILLSALPISLSKRDLRNV